MRNNKVAISRGRYITCSGDPIHDQYSPEMQEDGQIVLVKVAEENTDEMIQSFYESTTLESILSRFAQGDASALNKYEPIYMDVTQQPKNLAEALQKIINSRSAFDALPTKVKNAFGNDFNRWLASAGTMEWYNEMKEVFPSNNNNGEAVATERSEDSKASKEE